MSNLNSFPARHEHVFLGSAHDRHERRTWLVVGLTAVTMVAEIVAGTAFGSMALVADGWHMSTHAAALGIAAFAYRFARQHARDSRFSFGTGKLGDLAAFASALLLMLVALAVGWESAMRLSAPVAIDFTQATVIAVLGLIVNLASAWLLKDGHDHHHGHSHGGSGHRPHDHGPDHHDHHHHAHGGGHGADTNLRAAYTHVVADAFTSILAIAALLGGRFYGWVWLDPVMGIVGACVIAHWSVGLLRSSGAILLDTVPDETLAKRIGERIAAEGAEIADLHLWQVGPGHRSAIVSIVTREPKAPAVYKQLLADLPTLSHVTVEVNARPAVA
ncbi:CDF family Co(II)/Ni(II) efflux transporter DmeF [Bosea sp. NBC_00550]|uniref:CDF family Co(II)/Ni(II) efflux transporter DmeF n=1 Tax=Bosea sp. NBC_00550 TaxID=2969621 RepID=UPI00223240D9|nr:CDF family Co(II)/Ni(II) efflux transporter DmeF [Bosea sp. NBC_00550]UZF94031.1 CDF family Co(II)/Ni(II) efflux transporter DmeF [Bosea sp. NBC_00550]